MKKFLKIAAAVLTAGVAATLSGCAGCNSCAGNTRNLVPLDSNWYANTIYGKIQPTFIDSPEVVNYKVTFDKSTALNSVYSVDYSDGTYKTTFVATHFDKDAYTCEEYAEGYADDLTVYCYKTELNINTVTFTFGDATYEANGDSVYTECYFMPVEDYLRPLYSHQIIKSTTPANLQPTSLESAYKTLNVENEVFYSFDGNNAKAVSTVDGEKTVKFTDGLLGSANSLFDVASLDIVARANKLTADVNQPISLYTVATGVQNYTLTSVDGKFSSDAEAHRNELNEYKNILDQNGLYEAQYDEENNEKDLSTVALSVKYSGSLEGKSQTYWFAGINNSHNNTGRATLLKISVPIPYSLGTLNYSLESIDSTFWNE